jgi:ABC-2 type transport system ATP-binding protein
MPDTSRGKPIVIKDLSKTYPKGIQAVRNISFAVGEGEILALLGPNGAGKTTVLKTLACLSPPTSGSAEVCGFDVTKQRGEVVRRIGFVGQSSVYDSYATPESHLRLYGRLYGLGGKESRSRSDELLRRFGLEADRRRKVATLSGGMRRRLDIVTALIQEPEILIMDEPTTGLDPSGRQSVWSLINELNGSLGMTVLFTTHYLDEADQHAASVVVIDHGAIIAEGSPAALKDRLGGTSLILRFDPGADLEAARRTVELSPDTVRIVQSENVLQVILGNARQTLAPILKMLFDAQVPFTSIEVQNPSLDQVYFSLTGKEFSEAEPEKPATALGWGAYRKVK